MVFFGNGVCRSVSGPRPLSKVKTNFVERYYKQDCCIKLEIVLLLFICMQSMLSAYTDKVSITRLSRLESKHPKPFVGSFAKSRGSASLHSIKLWVWGRKFQGPSGLEEFEVFAICLFVWDFPLRSCNLGIAFWLYGFWWCFCCPKRRRLKSQTTKPLSPGHVLLTSLRLREKHLGLQDSPRSAPQDWRFMVLGVP